MGVLPSPTRFIHFTHARRATRPTEATQSSIAHGMPFQSTTMANTIATVLILAIIVLLVAVVVISVFKLFFDGNNADHFAKAIAARARLRRASAEEREDRTAGLGHPPIHQSPW